MSDEINLRIASRRAYSVEAILMTLSKHGSEMNEAIASGLLNAALDLSGSVAVWFIEEESTKGDKS
jgi:hypothetical protein